jgi:hypothetical protein
VGYSQSLCSTTESGIEASADMDTGVMPEALKSALEAATRGYVMVASSPAETPVERRELARRSAAVGLAFRNMAAVPGLEWWALAALSTAAEAFEQQAQYWNAPHPWATGSRRRQGGRHGDVGDGGR